VFVYYYFWVLGSKETTMNAFVMAAFVKFIAFSIFEMRYMLIIWKARDRSTDPETGWEAMRTQVSALYTKMCKS
jgi:transmembrane E3 ubiquitin-protein ligase